MAVRGAPATPWQTAYIAKYASKATEDAGGTPRPIRSSQDLNGPEITGHARRLITA